MLFAVDIQTVIYVDAVDSMDAVRIALSNVNDIATSDCIAVPVTELHEVPIKRQGEAAYGRRDDRAIQEILTDNQ